MGEVLFIFADLRHDFCTIVSNERFWFKIMLLRHAQPRKPKNEALLYSFIANEEVRYSRGFTLRHATIRLQLMRHATIQIHLLRHATIQNCARPGARPGALACTGRRGQGQGQGPYRPGRQGPRWQDSRRKKAVVITAPFKNFFQSKDFINK